jgi:hypothetical protein
MFSMYEMDRPIEISVSNEKGKTGKLTMQLNRSYIRRVTPVRSTLLGTNGQINTQAKPSPSMSLDVVYKFEKESPQKLHHFISPQGMGLEIENLFSQPEVAIFLAATSRISPQEDAVRFGQLDILGKQQEIIDFLRETVEPRLTGLSTIAVGDQSLIHAQLEGSARKIPVSYMGDGMARLLSVILVLTTTANGYVFIDELENGIHYSAFPKVWLGIVKAAQRFNCQVFATTHSYECLQAAIQGLPEDLRDQFCYVRLERSGEHISGRTYAYEVLGADDKRKQNDTFGSTSDASSSAGGGPGQAGFRPGVFQYQSQGNLAF